MLNANLEKQGKNQKSGIKVNNEISEMFFINASHNLCLWTENKNKIVTTLNLSSWKCFLIHFKTTTWFRVLISTKLFISPSFFDHLLLQQSLQFQSWQYAKSNKNYLYKMVSSLNQATTICLVSGRRVKPDWGPIKRNRKYCRSRGERPISYIKSSPLWVFIISSQQTRGEKGPWFDYELPKLLLY